MSQILRNSIVTPDGTELVSRYRNDFVSYKDANGETYHVDGGNDYLKRGWSGDHDYVDTSIEYRDPHPQIRASVEWGKLVEGEHVWIKIQDLDSEHIVAILEGDHAGEAMSNALQDELDWRHQ